MLFVYTGTETKVPLILDEDKKYVTHKEDGFDTLTFEINSNNEIYKVISEETRVEDNDNIYLVKNVDEHSDFVTIDCALDLDDWKKEIYKDFVAQTKTLLEVLEIILPTGWTISGDTSSFSKKKTVGQSGSKAWNICTAYEVFNRCVELWQCHFAFHVKTKVLQIIDISQYASSGVYISEQLNLRSLGFTGNTESFATRIYPYGKRDENGENPVTIVSVNPTGKEYIDDNSFANKIVSIGWSDERYTNPQTLYDDAKAKLKELANPVRSYACDVSSLPTTDMYMYMVITLIDIRRNLRIDHRVMEWKEYENHGLDTITLSTVAKSLESKLTKQNAQMDELSAAVDDITTYTSGYTLEFGELIGNATFYFTRAYVDRPYFDWRNYDGETPTIELIQRAGTYGAYIGARVTGLTETTTTLFKFYCSLPIQNEFQEES